MNNQKKALLVALAVAGVSISGPMVKWSLSCGASPVMIAFGRMAISFLLLLVPALRSGELQAILRAPKKQVALACAAGLLLALHYTCWMTSLSFASTFVSTALVCTAVLSRRFPACCCMSRLSAKPCRARWSRSSARRPSACSPWAAKAAACWATRWR
ncbi:MAG: hypothetical protein ACLS6G_07480 [Christensenellales bacterium]